MQKQYAFSPTIGAALNVTLLSYVDTCALGINVDTGAIPDFDVFYDCLAAGFDEVLGARGLSDGYRRQIPTCAACC